MLQPLTTTLPILLLPMSTLRSCIHTNQNEVTKPVTDHLSRQRRTLHRYLLTMQGGGVMTHVA